MKKNFFLLILYFNGVVFIVCYGVWLSLCLRYRSGGQI